MAVIDLKEEYANKLSLIDEKHEVLRQKLVNENGLLSRKVDSLKVQMGYMEKKEAKLFGQLEEAKELQCNESQIKDHRMKEMEELIFRKEATILDLEREIRTKEKTLMERQEQIAVLIGTLEGDNSRDELKQKVVNLSAELCSVKAIESQQVKKLNELTHHLKQVELQTHKGQKQVDSFKQEIKELSKSNTLGNIENTSLQRRIQELNMAFEESERAVSDLRQRIERDEFTMNMKQESI